MKTKLIIREIDAYVTRLFANQEKPALRYHAIAHTKAVVKAVELLSEHYKLDKVQHLTVVAAAWFHDVGYLLTSPELHEAKGSEVAATYLTAQEVPDSIIASVQACILATKMPQSPHNLLEQILCDADLFHLGSKDFKNSTQLLHQEQEQLIGQVISSHEWRQRTIQLLETHQYFTKYAQKLQQKQKAKNLLELQEKQTQKVLKSTAEPADQVLGIDAVDLSETKPKKVKEAKPDRGIETLFRTMSTNHLRLSEIADSKANIMISVNAVMISVVISVLSHRLEQYPYLVPPTALFLLTSLLTIIFAVLATRPQITEGRFSMDDVEQKRSNLTFFGNFYNMALADYESGIQAMMKDSDFLYGSMTRDVYYLGQVLSKKYKLLRIAYTIFMYGFVVSILAFLGVFLASM